MGTRHLICVVSDGDYRIAQYGQWDGYPEGQGAVILEFLKSPMAEQLKKNLKLCSWFTNDEYEKLWEPFGVNKDQDFIEYETYKAFCSEYPQLSRDTGAGILKIVADASGEIKLLNSLDFSEDSLFCEWAYVIDFDKDTFEVYQGFNETPLEESERFYRAGQADDNGMYPVKIVESFDLSNLPSMKEFLEKCEPDEEETMETTISKIGGLTGI